MTTLHEHDEAEDDFSDAHEGTEDDEDNGLLPDARSLWDAELQTMDEVLDDEAVVERGCRCR